MEGVKSLVRKHWPVQVNNGQVCRECRKDYPCEASKVEEAVREAEHKAFVASESEKDCYHEAGICEHLAKDGCQHCEGGTCYRRHKPRSYGYTPGWRAPGQW